MTAAQQHLVVVLLGLAVAAGGTAWQWQSSAADALVRAQEIQEAKVAEDDSPPPDLDQYRAILERLDESVAIRRGVDEQLARIERVVASLQRTQGDARDISLRTASELDQIAALLGGAVQATDRSVRDLGTVTDELRRSRRLARLIAAELEELDRKMGPTIGRELPSADLR
ncbi:MAG: hypothetical protein ACRDKZ_01135 [Actinomycetota bacterium]